MRKNKSANMEKILKFGYDNDKLIACMSTKKSLAIASRQYAVNDSLFARKPEPNGTRPQKYFISSIECFVFGASPVIP